MLSDTCILYFTRSASEELKFKRLHRKRQLSLRAIESMQGHTQKIIQKSGIPFIVCSEDQQVGHTFGEKISSAIQDCFVQYEHVIVVGYDCPQLAARDLLDAHDSLVKGNNILGVDSHGGAYLIGINKVSWDKEAFQRISWNSSLVAQELTEHFFTSSNLLFLLRKADVNSFDDLQKLHFLSFLSPFICMLIQLFEAIRIETSVQLDKGFYTRIIPSFRGPPLSSYF